MGFNATIKKLKFEQYENEKMMSERECEVTTETASANFQTL